MSSQLPIYLLDEIRLSEFMTLLKNTINQREREVCFVNLGSQAPPTFAGVECE